MVSNYHLALENRSQTILVAISMYFQRVRVKPGTIRYIDTITALISYVTQMIAQKSYLFIAFFT